MDYVNPACLFCKIAGKMIPAALQYEDDKIVAFNDTHPKAKTHILLVPRKHIATIDHLEQADIGLIGDLIYRAQQLAREKGIAQGGYRLVFNVREHAGQTVDHIHLHLIGGGPLGSMA